LLDLRRHYGMTVLITTHDMEEAEALSDRLAILHLGRVSVIGKPSELRATLGDNATMNDVFVHYAGGLIHESGMFNEVAQTRRTAQRLG
jgi:ABC-2 type transport system ATP-binding protein